MDFFNMDLTFLLIQAPVILLSLTVHEYSHALVANRLGDDTAKREGRLTLNPIPHLDVLGTVLMFLVGFGWAKPVPVDSSRFDDPKRGMLLVALAGPFSNLITAVFAGFALRYLTVSVDTADSGLMSAFLIGVILALIYGVALAIFNLLPIPPLDGSRIMYGILPDRYVENYARFEPYGVIFLFVLFIFGGEIFSTVVWRPVSWVSELLSGYTFSELWSIISFLST